MAQEIGNTTRNIGASDSDDVAEADVVQDPTDITDGRTLRRRRNRDAVINALIGLINEGDLEPTIDKIADRAEVSARSIFRYFTDLNDLARTAVETEMRKAIPDAVIANVGEGSFDERVDTIVASRVKVLSATWRLLRVAKAKSNAIPEIDRGLGVVADMLNDQFNRQFANELSRLAPDEAEALAMSLSMMMGHDVYDIQRRRHDRTDEEIAHGWRLVVTRALS